MSEFHRQCVFSALAVVSGVDGENILFPSAQLCWVVLPDAVNIDRVDAAQRTEQPFLAELAVVQLHKVHHLSVKLLPGYLVLRFIHHPEVTARCSVRTVHIQSALHPILMKPMLTWLEWKG